MVGCKVFDTDPRNRLHIKSGECPATSDNESFTDSRNSNDKADIEGVSSMRIDDEHEYVLR